MPVDGIAGLTSKEGHVGDADTSLRYAFVAPSASGSGGRSVIDLELSVIIVAVTIGDVIA
jgi:hypothetical protein